ARLDAHVVLVVHAGVRLRLARRRRIARLAHLDGRVAAGGLAVAVGVGVAARRAAAVAVHTVLDRVRRVHALRRARRGRPLQHAELAPDGRASGRAIRAVAGLAAGHLGHAVAALAVAVVVGRLRAPGGAALVAAHARVDHVAGVVHARGGAGRGAA